MQAQSKLQGDPAGSLLGCVVLTPYGWGTVLGDDPASLHLRVALDWRLGNGQRAQASLRRTDVLERSFCPVGQCVETAFGSGVLLDFRREDRMHAVRLWRPRGRGAGTLYCRADALKQVLPAAVGFPVTTPYGNGTVRAVSSTSCPGSEDRLRFEVSLPWATASLDQASLWSPAAAALPLAECVGQLADRELAHCLSAIQGARRGLAASGMGAQAEWLLQESGRLLQQASGGDTRSSGEDGAGHSCESQLQSSLECLIDEGLGRVRALAGEQQRQQQLQGQQLRRQQQLLSVQRQRQQQQLQLLQQRRLLEEQGLLGGTSEPPDGALRSRSQDLHPQVPPLPPPRELLPPIAPRGRPPPLGPLPPVPSQTSGAAVGDRGLREALEAGGESMEDALLEMLCRGASLAGIRFDAPKLREAMHSDPSVQFVLSALRSKEGELRKLREGLRSTKTGQVVLGGQQSLSSGARCLRVAGAPRVDRLRARGLRLADGLLAHAPAREKAAELLLGAWQVVDQRLARTSGQEAAAFLGAGTAKLLVHYSRRVGKLTSSLEALDLAHFNVSVPLGARGAVVSEQLEQRLAGSLEASRVDPRLTGVELLERFRDQRPGAPAWESALLDSLDAEELASGASRAVEKGEALLRGLDRIQSSGLLRSALEHLEGEDLEGRLLRGIARFDARAFLADFHGALDSAQGARERLLSRLLDCCLEGLLDVVPAMRIPELTGEHRRIAYRVVDLDMSGVRFRKEDVHLTMPGLVGVSSTSPPAAQGCKQAASHDDWNPSDLVRLEAQGVSAEFRHLRCALKPPLLPEVCVTTDAKALGITLRIGFAKDAAVSGRREAHPGLKVSRLQVAMESLDISLDKSNYSRLFNPLIGYFNDLLKGYVCGCLEECLAGPARELCTGLGSLLAEAEPLLDALGKASAALSKQPPDEQEPCAEKLHAEG